MSLYSQIKNLRDERRRLHEQANALIPNDNEPMASDARENFDQIHKRMDDLMATIECLERSIDAEAQDLALRTRGRESLGTSAAARQDDGGGDGDSDGSPSFDADARRAARLQYFRTGLGGCTPEQRQALRYVDASTRNLPQEFRAALSSGSDVSGGIMVPSEDLMSITEARKQWGSLRRTRAETITTSHGKEIPYPVVNDTQKRGRRLGSGKKVRTTEIELGNFDLKAHIYTSEEVVVPFDLLEDTEHDLEAYLFRIFFQRIEREFNYECTVSSGSGGPTCLGAKVKVGHEAKGVDEDGNPVIDWTDLVDLESEVDAEYLEGIGEWMFARKTLGHLKKMKDGDNRPIWLSGVAVREPDTVLEKPYVINNDMSLIASGKKPIILGDFESVKIRDVVPPLVLRLRERHAENMSQAFLMFSRHDMKYINAGTDPLKALKIK